LLSVLPFTTDFPGQASTTVPMTVQHVTDAGQEDLRYTGSSYKFLVHNSVNQTTAHLCLAGHGPARHDATVISLGHAVLANSHRLKLSAFDEIDLCTIAFIAPFSVPVTIAEADA
jgi:hypothetical protein